MLAPLLINAGCKNLVLDQDKITSWWFSVFSSTAYLIMHRVCKEKLQIIMIDQACHRTIPLSFLSAVTPSFVISLVSSLVDLRCSVGVLHCISPLSVSTVLIISRVPNSVSLNFKLLPVEHKRPITNCWWRDLLLVSTQNISVFLGRGD